MWRGAFLLLLLAVTIQAANIYQLCGVYNGNQLITMDPLVKNFTDTPYSYQLDPSTTLYYNFCGGISKCNGAMMCTEGPAGLTILASAGDDVYAYYNGGGISMYYYPPRGFISLQVTCSPSQTTPLVVTDVDHDDYSTYMYFSTPVVCQGQPSVTRQPVSHNYISGEIYMVGEMPMWTFDYVSAAGNTAFVGNFYYSYPNLSFKLNGTLSNSKGQKSSVELIVNGRPGLDNPVTSVSIFQPSSGKTSCVLLPTPKSYNSLYWFSPQANDDSIVRPYESIYWNKGARFNVTEYFYTPYYTLMQRESDSATVALGQYFLAPFVNADYNTFVTEVKWDSLSYGTLSASTFEIPATCKQ